MTYEEENEDWSWWYDQKAKEYKGRAEAQILSANTWRNAAVNDKWTVESESVSPVGASKRTILKRNGFKAVVHISSSFGAVRLFNSCGKPLELSKDSRGLSLIYDYSAIKQSKVF